jgi:hypothetical protein
VNKKTKNSLLTISQSGLRIVLVDGNKDALIDDGRTAQELGDLAYTQKPPKFSDEKEFRFCLVAMGVEYLSSRNTKGYLDIDLGSGLRSYAKLI